jgi:hypothetical protein
MVSVTVLDVIGNGAPAANIPVIFIDPDGTVAADTTTDSNGRAHGNVLPGASVTTVWFQNNHYLVVTMTEIKPGDDLPIGFTDRDSTANGTFAVTFPALAGASSYQIFTPCGSFPGSPGTTNNVNLNNSCRPATFDVSVVANDASGAPFQAAHVENVALASGGVNVPANWVSFSTFSASYTNVPADVTSIMVSRASGSRRGFSTGTSGMPVNGQLSLTATVPAVGTHAWVNSTVTRMAGGGGQSISQRVVGNAINYNIDVGANLMPWMTNVTFDIPSRTFTPVAESTATNYDMFGVDMQFSRTDTSTPPVTTSVEWLILGPSIKPLAMATVPTHVGPVTPIAGDTVGAVIGVLIDANTVTGWDATRPLGFALIDSQQFSDNDFDTVKEEFVIGTH